MLSSSSSVRRWNASSVLGKEGCGGPVGRGTRGASSSCRVAIFLVRAVLLGRVRGAMVVKWARFVAKWVDCGFVERRYVSLCSMRKAIWRPVAKSRFWIDRDSGGMMWRYWKWRDNDAGAVPVYYEGE